MEKFRDNEMLDYFIIRNGKRIKLSKLIVDDEEHDEINDLNKSFVVNFD